LPFERIGRSWPSGKHFEGGEAFYLLGNLETGKSKKEFCASLRFRTEKVVAGTKWDTIGQFGTTADRFGQSGTLSTDCDGATRCHKRPQKATKTKARAGDSWRQKTTIGDSGKQKATKGDNWNVRDNWRHESSTC